MSCLSVSCAFFMSSDFSISCRSCISSCVILFMLYSRSMLISLYRLVLRS